MKPFEQMTQSEQYQHFIDVHGVVDVTDLADWVEGHDKLHEWFDQDHQHQHNWAHERIWNGRDVRLEQVDDE